MAAASATPPAVPSVNLAQIIKLLHTHLTAALCNTVFQRVRNRERQRRWSLAALAQFWLTVLLTGPRSLTPGVARNGHHVPPPGAGGAHLSGGLFPTRRAAAARPSSASFTTSMSRTWCRRPARPTPPPWRGCASASPRSGSWTHAPGCGGPSAQAHLGCPLAVVAGVPAGVLRPVPRLPPRLSFCADAGRSELQHALEQLPPFPKRRCSLRIQIDRARRAAWRTLRPWKLTSLLRLLLRRWLRSNPCEGPIRRPCQIILVALLLRPANCPITGG